MNPTNRIYKARGFAHAAHDSIKQIRKYTNEPYWKHTDEVAGIVLEIVLPGGYTGESFTKEQFMAADDIIIAAHLHDILEDVNTPNFSAKRISELFGNNVLRIVTELTDEYTKENYPNLNRAERKKLEAHRLGKISKEAKLIKMADLLSNTTSIVDHDPEFAKYYLKEKEYILSFFDDANPVLLERIKKQLMEEKKKLNII